MSDIREEYADALMAKLPGGWLVVPDERTLDVLDRRTLIVSIQGFEPFALAPLSHLTIRFTLRVLSPATDLTEAELDLLGAVSDLLAAIDASGLDSSWSSADKLIHRDRYLGYDVASTVTTERI